MIKWLASKFRRFKTPSPHQKEQIAVQPHGEVFPWSKGVVLTAIDEVVIEVPRAALADNQEIGSVVLGGDDMEICIPPDGDSFFLRLKSGMSVSLNVSVQARIVSEDRSSRRLKVRIPSDAGVAHK